MCPLTCFPPIEASRIARLAFLDNPNEEVLLEFESRISKLGYLSKNKIFWEYAKSIKYAHKGLSSLAYMAHPVRVAMMYIDFLERPSEFGINLALLHNVLEVSNEKPLEIEEKIGLEILKSIELLTVDRSRQWDSQYKKNYYEKIYESKVEVQQIKLIDKLDNLYMLCLNNDEGVREKYLREIEEWIIPLAKLCMPNIEVYITELVEFNRKIGYSPT